MNGKMGAVLSAVVALACGGLESDASVEPSAQGIAVAISPLVASVTPGGSVAFDAEITGTANTNVLWSVEEGDAGGSVTTSGLYSAPAAEGSYHVLVASAADVTRTARATVTVAAAAGNVLTVAQDGSGNYRTIQAAADAATAGTTVIIRPGTYREAVKVNRSGAAGAYITFQADPGVIIDGGKTLPTSSYAGLVTFHNQHYLKFINLNVVNSANFGLYGQYAGNIVIQGGSVSATKNGGIYLSDGSSMTVDGVDVHHTNDIGLSAWGESISISGVDGFEVKNCKVHDSAEEGIDAKDGSVNGLIHHNDVFNNGSVAVYVDMASDIQIYANRIHGCGKSMSTYCFAMAVEGGRAGVADEVRRIRFFNNLVYDSSYGGVGFWGLDTGVYSDIQIVNNTFHGITGPAFPINESSSQFQGVNVIRNNIFWNLPGTLFSGSGVGAFTIDHNLFASGQRSTTLGTSPVTTSNVAFVDAASANFDLSSSSPAIDGGVSTLAPVTDYRGRSRPSGAATDIGAYEYAP